MTKYLLAFDLGTGGSRASLYDEAGICIGSVFEAVETRYSWNSYHEQRPDSWVEAVLDSGAALIQVAAQENGIMPRDIVALAVGGHSLGTVGLDAEGIPVTDWTPIWSDSRAIRQAEEFFSKIDEKSWYERTGAGVPVANYPLFKMLWMRENMPDLFAEIAKVVGTKEYVNFRLTGKLATDPSSAAGFGAWNIRAGKYDEDIVAAAELAMSLFPDVLPSTDVLGNLLPDMAIRLGISPQTKVIVSGVDNCCIALGARCYQKGRLAASLGSGSWIARCSDTPLINYNARPFIYPHVVPGQFLCSVGVFSSGTAIRWVKNRFCHNIVERAEQTGHNPYLLMAKEAKRSKIGANRLIFNPSLAGPSCGGEKIDLRGGLFGLSLSHNQADIIRAVMEGVVMNMRMALDRLKLLGPVEQPVVLAGETLVDLVANIYIHTLAVPLVLSKRAQSMPGLGIAALAAVGAGLWSDWSPLEKINRNCEQVSEPDLYCVEKYEHVYNVFKKTFDYMRQFANDWNNDILVEDE